MRTASSLSVLVGFACLAFNAFAETEQVSSTAYWVVVQEPETVQLPEGRTVAVNSQTHANVVRENGDTASQWCTSEQWLDGDGQPMRGAGYCTLFLDEGSVLWVSFVGFGPGKPSKWTVMGGTGEYEGATGGGTTQTVSQRSDGYAWTSKSTGKIVTP